MTNPTCGECGNTITPATGTPRGSKPAWVHLDSGDIPTLDHIAYPSDPEHSNCLNPADNHHAIDCPSNPRYEAGDLDGPDRCVPCIDGDHDECRDGGIHNYPFWCDCAKNRHCL
jgi:hypothetical protein